MKKANTWRGLTFVLSIFLAVMIVAGSILETYATTIDDALGTQSARIVITDGEGEAGMFESFKLPQSMLNPDGTGNAEAMIRTYIEFGRRQASGGSVLLKNENQALPLPSGSKVTLLGIRSHKMLQGAAVGMPIRGPVINFEEALSGERTNFHNPANLPTGNEAVTGWREKVDANTLSDYAFTDVGGPGAGYILNPDMISAYETINQTLRKKFHTVTPPLLSAGDDVVILGKLRQTYISNFGSGAYGCIVERLPALFLTDIDGFFVEGSSLRKDWDKQMLDCFQFSYMEL